jgi:U32 family peptidase
MARERPVAVAGSRATMRIDKPASAGDRVFRVASAALENAARRTFVPDDAGRSVSARVHVRALEGEPLEISLEAGSHRGSASGPALEPARTKPLTAQDIAEHVGRLGGTPFHADSWDIELGPGVGAGFSLLHRVRREAVEALERSMLAEYGQRARTTLSCQPARPSRRRDPGRCPTWWCGRLDLPRLRRAWPPALTVRSSPRGPCRPTPSSPRGWWSRRRASRRTPRSNAHSTRVHPVGRSWWGISDWCDLGRAGADVWAHWSLNAVNAGTVEALREAGASGAWLSPEVSGRDAAAIAGESGIPVGIAMLGRQEVMVTEHCVLMSSGPCSQRCGTCTRRERWYALRDRKGYGFPVITDTAGPQSHLQCCAARPHARTARDRGCRHRCGAPRLHRRASPGGSASHPPGARGARGGRWRPGGAVRCPARSVDGGSLLPGGTLRLTAARVCGGRPPRCANGR